MGVEDLGECTDVGHDPQRRAQGDPEDPDHQEGRGEGGGDERRGGRGALAQPVSRRPRRRAPAPPAATTTWPRRPHRRARTHSSTAATMNAVVPQTATPVTSQEIHVGMATVTGASTPAATNTQAMMATTAPAARTDQVAGQAQALVGGGDEDLGARQVRGPTRLGGMSTASTTGVVGVTTWIGRLDRWPDRSTGRHSGQASLSSSDMAAQAPARAHRRVSSGARAWWPARVALKAP